MFTVTKKQFEVLSDHILNNFIRESSAHLKLKFPVSTKDKSDQNLNEIIVKNIEIAAEYNIVEQADVLSFLEYIICLGSDFHHLETNRRANEILTMSNIDGSDKISLLISETPLYPEIYHG
jgi:hypothetical protein